MTSLHDLTMDAIVSFDTHMDINWNKILMKSQVIRAKESVHTAPCYSFLTKKYFNLYEAVFLPTKNNFIYYEKIYLSFIKIYL